VSDGILERVQVIVAMIAGPERTPGDAGPDTPIGESGYWLDSVDVLEVILACEREFGTAFATGDDLCAETLSSPRRLAELIRARVSA
jgi:acyl carrier protein